MAIVAVEIEGEPDKIDEAVAYLCELGVTVERIDEGGSQDLPKA
jgi:hypothetical protein